MKNMMFVGLVSLLIFSTVALASQSEGQKKDSPMGGMMEQMMKGGEGMGGMMRMMKMMDQCSAMMESAHAESGKAKEGQKEERR